MDPIHIIKELKGLRGVGFFGVHHVLTFKCYRDRKQGGAQEVTINISDAGSDQRARYHCVATSDDGKKATGNPTESIKTTLAIVHWSDLDG